MQIKFREPIILPKTIPLQTIETLLNTIYKQYHNASSSYQKKNSLRDLAVIELLFATEIRISELCTIQPQNIDLQNAVIIIKGKGAKERLIHICDKHVITALDKYRSEYDTEIHSCGYFFVNSIGNRLSDQSVREMINKYCHIADIQQHITPHMFRHSFATLLLEEDVDLRGHCFVSLMLCIPVWNKGRICYFSVPPGYRMRQKKESKLELAASMVRQAMPEFCCRKNVIILCDSWYVKKDLVCVVDEYKNLDLIGNARSDSVIYDLYRKEHYIFYCFFVCHIYIHLTTPFQYIKSFFNFY